MQNQFVKVSNTIFNYNLSPKAVLVYIYLSARANKMHEAIVKLATISKNCNMDSKTVISALKELERIKMIVKANRYNQRGYLANRYFLKNLFKENNKWFAVPTEVFKTKIKATDFVIFAYITKCMDHKNKEAFPSLSAIANNTGVSRGRVASAISYLRKHTFINRVKRKYKRTRAYRHNRYLQFKMQPKNKKRNACTKNRTSKSKTELHITLDSTNCQSFFIDKGSTHFP